MADRAHTMSELRTKLERDILPLVARPSRYIGGERNATPKGDEGVALRFLLAFPDVYEIGMSHLGIRVLYDILNRRPDVAAERAFAPWTDMEARMREARIPLFSLETTRPAREFDVVGFTLQYELHYTNVLAMLDLAGIPLRADDRRDGDPFVIGGGPVAFNPEPIADSFDLVLVGDGESAILDLADHFIAARREGRTRAETLAMAAGIPGVYVPSLGIQTTVVRRVEPTLGYDSHPNCPIVAGTEATHDRFALEIMRGCTRGCRFCQAGMATRPVRERAVDDLVRLVEEGLATSGFDEVSLLSLSPSDYRSLPELVSKLNERLFDRRVSISLPSLRVDRFSLDLADGVGRVRRSGLTFAPEAGTQRLRDVINKNETEEHILETADVAFASGWNRIKLYFMIGLPTETDADLEGIAALVRKVRDVAWSRRKGALVSVSISPFVPRPGTPFQWERQDSLDETRRKERLLRSLLTMRGVKLSLRDPRVSFLEGVLSRGDRRLWRAVEAAWRGGARFDGWSESFDFGAWERAFAEAGVDPAAYLAERDPAAALPWDHISSGVSKAYLLKERERAFRGETTPDCREAGCLDCGACSEDGRRPRALPARNAVASARPMSFGRRERRKRPGADEGPVRYRVRYAKGGNARFLSHLDIVRAMSRAIAVGGVPVAFSRGFNPHPRLSFGPPLPVGAVGDGELIDVELTRDVTPEELGARIGEGLPRGLTVLSVSRVPAGGSIVSETEAAEYVITGIPGLQGLAVGDVEARLAALLAVPGVSVTRRTAGRDGAPADEVRKELVPAREIQSLGVVSGDPPAVRAVLWLPPVGLLRPADLVRLLAVPGAGAPELALVRRAALLRRAPGATGGLEPVL